MATWYNELVGKMVKWEFNINAELMMGETQQIQAIERQLMAAITKYQPAFAGFGDFLKLLRDAPLNHFHANDGFRVQAITGTLSNTGESGKVLLYGTFMNDDQHR